MLTHFLLKSVGSFETKDGAQRLELARHYLGIQARLFVVPKRSAAVPCARVHTFDVLMFPEVKHSEPSQSSSSKGHRFG